MASAHLGSSSGGDGRDHRGRVNSSRASKYCIASARETPHMSARGVKDEQTAGRSGAPNNRHRPSSVSCTHGTPAGLPRGIPGIGEEMDGAIQHAAHPERQEKVGSMSPA
jgi:hypothetical protein